MGYRKSQALIIFFLHTFYVPLLKNSVIKSLRINIPQLLLGFGRVRPTNFYLFLGFVSSCATNPIWLVKTRLQLDRSEGGFFSVIKNIRAEQVILFLLSFQTTQNYDNLRLSRLAMLYV